MIRIRRVGRKPDPYIPTATMADIVFLLIIFFIVTYNIEVDKAKVQLPRTTVRTDVPRDAAYVSVDTEGIIRVSSGKETSVPVSAVEEVQTFAQNVVAQTPDKPFVVKADKNTRFQIIDKVLDALKQARVRTIFLLSEQRTISDKT
ncbi:MAG: biopolymer transporter ExbD [Thermoanaerobaculum sp.]|nr:biopolymer transporter ExbD [Thermoanaerobaculum sp.]